MLFGTDRKTARTHMHQVNLQAVTLRPPKSAKSAKLVLPNSVMLRLTVLGRPPKQATQTTSALMTLLGGYDASLKARFAVLPSKPRRMSTNAHASGWRNEGCQKPRASRSPKSTTSSNTSAIPLLQPSVLASSYKGEVICHQLPSRRQDGELRRRSSKQPKCVWRC